MGDYTQPYKLRAVNWQRNLAALWFAEFAALFGFTFVFPFLPIYLHIGLKLHEGASLNLWTGLVAGGSGLGTILFSPLWGFVADRTGRKPALLRAIIAGAVTVSFIAFVQTPWQLLGLRIIQGGTAGTIAAATALVAAETPRAQVARALGILGSAIALGSAAGPAVGSLLAVTLGLRSLFFGAGILLAVSALPVLLVVHETNAADARSANRQSGSVPTPRLDRRALVSRVLVVLFATQLLVQFGYAATEQLTVLRMLAIDPHGAATATGIAFGAAGLAATLGSAIYSRILGVTSYKRFAVASAALLAVNIEICSLVPNIASIVIAIAVFGLLYGCLSPLLYAMIGLEAPSSLQATVYGFSGSAIAVGFAGGPIICGVVSLAYGIGTAMEIASAAAAVATTLLLALAREPTSFMPEPGASS